MTRSPLQKVLSMHHSFLKKRRINVECTFGGSNKSTKRKALIKTKTCKMRFLTKEGKISSAKQRQWGKKTFPDPVWSGCAEFLSLLFNLCLYLALDIITLLTVYQQVALKLSWTSHFQGLSGKDMLINFVYHQHGYLGIVIWSSR